MLIALGPRMLQCFSRFDAVSRLVTPRGGDKGVSLRGLLYTLYSSVVSPETAW